MFLLGTRLFLGRAVPSWLHIEWTDLRVVLFFSSNNWQEKWSAFPNMSNYSFKQKSNHTSTACAVLPHQQNFASSFHCSAGGVDERGELHVPSVCVSVSAARVAQRKSPGRTARAFLPGCSPVAAGGPSWPLGLPTEKPPSVGHPSPRWCRTNHLCVARRSGELPHSGRLPRQTRPVVERGPPRRREGHLKISCHLLAVFSFRGWTAAAADNTCALSLDGRRKKDVQKLG